MIGNLCATILADGKSWLVIGWASKVVREGGKLEHGADFRMEKSIEATRTTGSTYKRLNSLSTPKNPKLLILPVLSAVPAAHGRLPLAASLNDRA